MKTPDGSVYGPVTRGQVDAWAAEGRISSQCLVQMQGQSHWQSALTLYPDLARLKPHGRPRIEQPRVTSRTVPRVPVDNVESPRKNNGVAICLLALVGLTMLFFPVLSLIALIWAIKERKAIESGQASSENRLFVDLGFFLALVSTIFGFFGIPTCAAFFID